VVGRRGLTSRSVFIRATAIMRLRRRLPTPGCRASCLMTAIGSDHGDRVLESAPDGRGSRRASREARWSSSQADQRRRAVSHLRVDGHDAGKPRWTSWRAAARRVPDNRMHAGEPGRDLRGRTLGHDLARRRRRQRAALPREGRGCIRSRCASRRQRFHAPPYLLARPASKTCR